MAVLGFNLDFYKLRSVIGQTRPMPSRLWPQLGLVIALRRLRLSMAPSVA